MCPPFITYEHVDDERRLQALRIILESNSLIFHGYYLHKTCITEPYEIELSLIGAYPQEVIRYTPCRILSFFIPLVQFYTLVFGSIAACNTGIIILLRYKSK